MSFLLVFVGLTLLVVGGNFLVKASVALSFKLKLSKLVIGMTVVSFATSAPELLVSLQAALNGVSDIALGNVLGSNIANIGLILGLVAFISPISVDRSFYLLNWPMMLLVSIALYVFLNNDALLSASEGMVLLVLLIVFFIILIKNSKDKANEIANEVDDTLINVSNFKIVLWLLIGVLGLYYGSDWLVNGAMKMAKSIGISDYVISVTVIAIGTSVPELAASVIAAFKKEKALSIGNLLGSNIFNIAAILGITSIIAPIKINPQTPEILATNIYWMIGFAAVLLPLAIITKRNILGRYKGFLLFVAYAIFILLTVL